MSMREAGLPPLYANPHGEAFLLTGSKAVVRAVYPETNRVDIETEDGSFLTQVLVIGPYFPEVHKDSEAPSHVGYLHVRGQAEAFCWPMPHRRLLGPQDQLESDSSDQPERRYYHVHHYAYRLGEVTVRLTRDNRYVIETEQNDYIVLDTQRREVRLHAPTVFVGTDEDNNRIEYEQDDSIRGFAPLILLGTETGDRIEYQDHDHVSVVTPKYMMGQLGLEDTDGITYLANSILHLMSTTIKLTASEAIVLDPPRISFGTATAAERVILGNIFQTFLNVFLTLFNAHQHSNVQNGGGTSGPPTTPTGMMPDSTLSTIAYVSQ